MDGWNGETPNLIPGTGAGYATAVMPPYQTAPNFQAEYSNAVYMRDLAFRAYVKAMKAGKEYTAEGMNLKRYDIAALRGEYIFWRDIVDTMIRHGSSSTMVWKHVIPYY
jgi:hypothetical protein